MTKSRKGLLLLVGIMLLLVVFAVGCSKKADTPTTTAGTSTPAAETSTPSKEPKPEPVKTAKAPAGNQIADSCATACHEMWPQVATWQTGVHARISCTTCHVDVKADEFKAAHESSTFAKPIAIRSKPVPDSACQGCHAVENRNFTPLPDLIIPHDQHIKANVACLDCHRFIAHGNLGQRKVTTRPQYANYDQWNPTMAKQVAPDVQRRPNMFVCIKCHEQRKITTKCAACHYWPNRATLPSHENPAWGTTHGKAGRQDVNDCAKCHYDKEAQKFATPSIGDLISDFARANTYCYNCHLKRPPNHDATWMAKHPDMANSRGILNCFACHDKDQPKPNVTGTYCNTCHWFKDTPKAPAAPKKP